MFRMFDTTVHERAKTSDNIACTRETLPCTAFCVAFSGHPNRLGPCSTWNFGGRRCFACLLRTMHEKDSGPIPSRQLLTLETCLHAGETEFNAARQKLLWLQESVESEWNRRGQFWGVAAALCQLCAHAILRIVKSDGVEFLRLQPEQSLDLVVATFAVHFMDRASLDKDTVTKQLLLSCLDLPGRGLLRGAYTSAGPRWPSHVVQPFGRLDCAESCFISGGIALLSRSRHLSAAEPSEASLRHLRFLATRTSHGHARILR